MRVIEPYLVTLAIAGSLVISSQALAFDDLLAPPPEPAGTVHVPQTNDTVQKELDQRLIDRFQKVVGTSPRLTKQQAKDASWGFVSDHFAEIDRDRKGYVGIDDIQAFLDSRSPTLPPVRAQNAAVIK